MENLLLTFITVGCFMTLTNAKCQLLRSGGLSQAEINEIVDMHNQFRMKVATGQMNPQPPASNMYQMSWDNELAAKAQSWADTCPSSHDPPAARGVSRFRVGQNMGGTYISTAYPDFTNDIPNFPQRITSWFREISQYRYNPEYNSATGHYTQMVWGDTYLIGCGYSYYTQSDEFVKKYVCNYGPAGNKFGSYPYQVGRMSCATPSTRYPGLCDAQGQQRIGRYY